MRRHGIALVSLHLRRLAAASVLLALPLLGQKETSDQTSAKAAAVQNATGSPVPSSESALTGFIDLGYRWRSDVAGSMDTYRSLVNLGEGPKVLGSEFTITGGKGAPLDTVHVRAYSWGDEPYATLHVDAFKARVYDFRADYRDLAYFNFVPSYADPLLSRGIVLNEQAFDQRRHISGITLDLRPGSHIIPYFGFDRTAASGSGVTTFASDANEYPVPLRSNDSTSLYRGGVRVELSRFFASVEEGGTVYQNNQNLFNTAPNNGNITAPVLGQKLTLGDMAAAYGIRGSSAYTVAQFTSQAVSWLDLYGQFRYSRPNTDVNFEQYAAGNFLLRSDALFYTGQQYLVTSAARLPHTSGSFGAEVRPFRRVRIMESWLTDRLDHTGSSNQLLATTGPANQYTSLLLSTLGSSYSQNEMNVIVDVTPKVVLRGGYRYVWGDASQAILPPAGLASVDHGTLRRHVGIGGVTYRPTRKLTLTADAEAASSGGVYFRTSLYDYQKVRGQARYQLSNSLNFAADVTTLANQNPAAGLNYDSFSHFESLSLFWSPRNGRYWTLQGAYTHSALRSDISFVEPQTFAPSLSRYRENGHTASGLITINPWRPDRHAPKISAGGAFYESAGSRPTSYFQPLAKVFVPLGRNAALFADWRYYGYGEAFYLYEGFRAHTVTAGLRLMR
jgi:hypothetical protein